MVMAAESLARVMRGVAAAVVANRAEAREVRNFIVVFGKRIVCSSESRGSVVVEIKTGEWYVFISGENSLIGDEKRKEFKTSTGGKFNNYNHLQGYSCRSPIFITPLYLQTYL